MLYFEGQQNKSWTLSNVMWNRLDLETLRSWPIMHQKSVHTLVQSLSVFFQSIDDPCAVKSFHTGTFFCVTTHTESLPRTPIEVIPADFTALNAYSGSFRETHANQHNHLMNEEQSTFNFTHLHNWFNVWLCTYWVPNCVHMWWFKDIFFRYSLTTHIFEVDRFSFSKWYVYCNGHWMKNNQKLTSNTYTIASIFDSTCVSTQLHTWWYDANLFCIHLHLKFWTVTRTLKFSWDEDYMHR